MNYLVVGAGNASRPVARLLNHLGHNVTVTDLKDISEFKIEFQRSLIEMEKEGVILDMPNKDPSVEGFDAVYLPPTLPESANSCGYYWNYWNYGKNHYYFYYN